MMDHGYDVQIVILGMVVAAVMDGMTDRGYRQSWNWVVGTRVYALAMTVCNVVIPSVLPREVSWVGSDDGR